VRAQLRRLIPILETFYFWPCPYGPLAQQVSLQAERELSARGAALRQDLVAESPHIDVALETGNDEVHAYKVPVLFDTSCSNAEYFKWLSSEELVRRARPRLARVVICQE
jgi:hypothetical protein